MFDNIGKPPTGILNGNTNWLGSFKACRAIEVSLNYTPAFHGKYCRTTLGFPLEALSVFKNLMFRLIGKCMVFYNIQYI